MHPFIRFLLFVCLHSNVFLLYNNLHLPPIRCLHLLLLTLPWLLFPHCRESINNCQPRVNNYPPLLLPLAIFLLFCHPLSTLLMMIHWQYKQVPYCISQGRHMFGFSCGPGLKPVLCRPTPISSVTSSMAASSPSVSKSV